MAEGGFVKLEATPIQRGGANQAPTEESDIIRRSIVYIETPKMIGTGSIVKFGDNSYLMTCNHVIPTEEMARETSIFFDKILQTGHKKPKNKGMEVKGQKLFSFDSDRWFLTSSEDFSEFDVTLIAIKMNEVPNLSKFEQRRQLDLSEYKEHLPEYSLKVNDGVHIWHYPENDKFRRNNSSYNVNSVSGHLFTHSAGTDHGSSGAPVFKICKGKEVAKEVVVGLHRGSLKNHSNPPDLNLATRIQAIRCMLSNKEQALEDVVWDVLLCQKGSSKEGSSEAPAKSESSDQDQQTMQPSATPVEDRRTLALREAHTKLKEYYTKRPANCKQFVNLAIVKRPSKVDKTKKDVKEFLEATAHGIDRYTGEQEKIEYKTILSSTDSDSGKRVLVSGSPGSGKTTLAHQLCRDLYSGHLPNQYQLVLFTELKAFRSYTNKPKNKEASLLTLLEYSGLHETDSLCSMIEKVEGRGVAIILDGYDEISDASCETMVEWVSELFRDAPHLKVSKCDVFITTRPSQLSQLITRDDSVHLEILGFSSRDIERYIKAYDFKDAPNKAEEVIRRLTDRPLVRGLCSNPRVLDIACKVLKHQDEEPLPANLSGIFLRYVCYQLEVDLKQRREDDLKQRQPPVETRIKDLLSVPKELFPGFYTLCSLAYRCCLNQQLILEKQELVEVKNYINCRGSVYNLVFGEEVDSPSAILCVLYQCDHKTVMEALAAVHIAALSKAEQQQQIWDKWFTAPHMAQVWMMYCGLTGLKSVDLTSLCSLTMSERSREVAKDLKAGALKSEDKLVMVSLFEADKVEEAERILPVLLKNTIQGYVTSQHDVLCLAYSITHHPDLSRVRLDLPKDCSELDLQPLTTSLRKVKAVQLVSQCSNMLTVLPRAVEDLTLKFLGSSPTRMEKSHNIAGPAQQKGTSKGLGDALRDCHCLRSLTVNRPPGWTELDGVLTNRSLTELYLKDLHSDVATPSVEILKNLLVHPRREKCSLKMKLTYDQLSTVLFGLKKADKLEELDLIDTNISSPKAVLNGLPTAKQERQFRLVEALVETHPHLAKVDVSNTRYGNKITVPLLIAVAKGAIRNQNITHLGLGHAEIHAVRGLLGLPSADHITSIRAEYTYTLYALDDGLYHDQGDAWSKDVIAGPMARHTCSLFLRFFPSAFLGLLLSRVNKAAKLKDLSLVVFGLFKGDFNLVDVRAVETAFSKCNLHKLRIRFKGVSDESHSHCHLQTAILNGLAANTTTQVDSCICSGKRITRHLSQQILQRFEEVRTEDWSFIISRDPPCPSAPVPAANPRDLLSTPPQSTSHMPETTPPGQTTPTHQTTPPDPPPTPPGVGELLRKYKDRIYSEVKSTVVSPRLQMEEVISREVAREIKDKGDKKGNCRIYVHLMEQGDLKSLQTFGTVLAEEEENVKMQRLGEDLLADITLPHGCP